MLQLLFPTYTVPVCDSQSPILVKCPDTNKLYHVKYFHGKNGNFTAEKLDYDITGTTTPAVIRSGTPIIRSRDFYLDPIASLTDQSITFQNDIFLVDY